MISAIMGAGKTDLTSELCRVAQHWGWRVLVTVPTQRLVRQTSAAIRQRLGDEAVGTYWQHGRDYNTPVVVACTRSLGKLQVEPCDYDLWIADEAHGTESIGVRVFAETIAPNRLIGLSATPFRADDREALSLFKTLCSATRQPTPSPTVCLSPGDSPTRWYAPTSSPT
jgi:superfamily II DNA or RNA helicase